MLIGALTGHRNEGYGTTWECEKEGEEFKGKEDDASPKLLQLRSKHRNPPPVPG